MLWFLIIAIILSLPTSEVSLLHPICKNSLVILCLPNICLIMVMHILKDDRSPSIRFSMRLRERVMLFKGCWSEIGVLWIPERLEIACRRLHLNFLHLRKPLKFILFLLKLKPLLIRLLNLLILTADSTLYFILIFLVIGEMIVLKKFQFL